MRTAAAIKLSDDDRRILERHARGRSTQARLVLRSKIALLAASGRQNKQIAEELRCSMKTVCLWRRRFAERGIAGIEKDAPRSGKRAEHTELLIQTIIETTLNKLPARSRRWSTRSLAAALGTSPSMVWRAWQAHGITAGRKPTTSSRKSQGATRDSPTATK